MYRQVVLLLGVEHAHVAQGTSIANLTTHLCIEWGLAEYYLIEVFALLVDLAITQNLGLAAENIISYKLGITFAEFYPITKLLFVGLTTHLLLTLKGFVVLLFVGGKAILAEDELGEVQRETIGIFQGKYIHARDHLALSHFHQFVEQADTFV